MRSALVYTTIFLILSSSSIQESLPPVFMKLEGKWQRIGKPDNFEYWENTGNSLWSESYKLAGGEKNILEKTKIKFIDESWYFIPEVPHNPAPVNFRITDIGDFYFYSENPTHDFPKWIRYEFIGLDSLNVIIGDKKDSVYFNFVRYP